jgi:hypothetical protein
MTKENKQWYTNHCKDFLQNIHRLRNNEDEDIKLFQVVLTFN